jgi:hypothetical protein
MDIETIRRRVHENPEPFLLRLSDGRTVDIPHRDFISFGKRVVIVVGSNDVARSFDPLHIVSLEEMPRPESK